MRRLLAPLLFLTLPALSVAQLTWTTSCNFAAALGNQRGTTQSCSYTINASNGQDVRTLKFTVPKNYTVGGPAVWYFHGSNGSTDECEWFAKLRTMAAAKGFILFCPKGNSGGTWNSWWMPPSATIFQDDGAFVLAMMMDAQHQLHVSPKKRFITGFSDGANILSRLIVEDGALIAAAAVADGSYSEWDSSRAAPTPPSPPQPKATHPVAVLLMRGYDNVTDPAYAMCDHPLDGSGRYNQPTMDEEFLYYKSSFKCKTVAPNAIPFCTDGRGSEPTGETWKHATDCTGGVEVYSYGLVNSRHAWYATTDITGTSGIYNFQLAVDFPNTAHGYRQEIVWEFFRQHPQP